MLCVPTIRSVLDACQGEQSAFFAAEIDYFISVIDLADPSSPAASATGDPGSRTGGTISPGSAAGAPWTGGNPGRQGVRRHRLGGRRRRDRTHAAHDHLLPRAQPRNGTAGFSTRGLMMAAASSADSSAVNAAADLRK